MQITVQLPDDIAHHENPSREVLEALVIEGYSAGVFTSHEASLLLGFDNRFDFDGFLKERGVEAGSYGFAQHEQDLRSLAKLDEERRKKRSA
jgi:hypothetical protein